MLITIGDNADRLRGEASFAALCGASPVEYSSGSRCHRRAQPRWRPAGQRRSVPDGADPAALGPANPGVLRAACDGRKDPARGHSLPETLRCPGDLPPRRPARTRTTPGIETPQSAARRGHAASPAASSSSRMSSRDSPQVAQRTSAHQLSRMMSCCCANFAAGLLKVLLVIRIAMSA
ncbi:transposase [Streptomyces lasiicapitis]|uniref:transposase n=1 Tax=Streptomyces lasiicapitis TaxID=1923961 RepID=UPI003657A122